LSASFTEKFDGKRQTRDLARLLEACLSEQSKPKEKGCYLLLLGWPVDQLGGVNTVVLSLAQQLHEQSAYTPLIAVASWEPPVSTAPVRGTQVIHIRLRDPYGPRRGFRMLAGFLARLPAACWRLGRLIRQRRIEVINAHFPELNVWVFLLLKWLRLFRGKILLSFHGADLTEVCQTQGLSRRMWRTLLTRVDAVVAVSEALRREVLDFAPTAYVVTIHNGADVALFNQPRTNRIERRSILHIGKFEHKKSQDVLLRAFRLLQAAIPNASLTMIGAQGPALGQVRQLIADLGLSERVEVHVNVPHEQLPGFMNRADLFVLPSRAEPFGIVLLEAGAAGLPVVATRVGGIPEIIEDGVTGLLVTPDEVAELEQAIRDLLTDTAKAARLAQAWHQRSVTAWSWRRTCEQYLDLVGQ